MIIILQKNIKFVIIFIRIEVGQMICDLYSSYYDYKVRTLNEYTLALSKIIGIKENKLFNNQKLRNDY